MQIIQFWILELSSKGKALSLCISKAFSTGIYLGSVVSSPRFHIFHGISAVHRRNMSQHCKILQHLLVR